MPPTTIKNLFDRWAVLILIGVGAFMFWGAGHYTVFDDEGLSCRRYSLPLAEMVSQLYRGEEPDPPLYYILQNLWVHLFGVGPLGLRSLSIVAFLAGLVFIRIGASEWYDDRTGLLAMFIAAVHPAHLLFGLAGRWYSLMFCMVAILFWFTGKFARQASATTGQALSWALIAAAVCYTNYFGVVVVAILWIVMIARSADPGRWVKPAVGALLLYSIWIPAFWKQATSFPQMTFSWSRYVDSGIRFVMAFTTGNLASISALWVWIPLFGAIFLGSSLLKIMAFRHPRSEPLAQIVGGCVLAGLISRTIIDKYIMAFSGLACILWSMIWLRSRQREISKWTRTLTQWISVLSAMAWLGCYFNLATQQHWSSLRWLDPYEQVIRELADNPASPPFENWIVSQPAARYYLGCMFARAESDAAVIPPVVWRRYAVCEPDSASQTRTAATPESMLERMKKEKPRRLVTLRGSEFDDAADWSAFQKVLDAEYAVVTEQTYLKDPDAKWKDRLDPTYKHPKWRITVRVFELRSQ